jgi:mono/diheme cytochrome c family protein
MFSNALIAAEDVAPGKPAPVPKKPEKKPQKNLTGAELYAIHCNRCHPERYAPERTPEQWQTILLHMRTRANLPAAHAKAILKYLQEDSGK